MIGNEGENECKSNWWTLYILPSNPTEGKDLTPTIRLLKEKIKQMERMLSA